MGSVMLGVLQADWDFSLISRRAEALYGPLGDGKQRIDAWQHLLATQKQTPELEQLKVVNLFFNKQMRYVEDIDLWRQVDYWETPIEGLWKGAGDCEDYAIAKYFSLRHLGVSSDKLRITYVKALRQNRAHMVLTYYASPDAMRLGAVVLGLIHRLEHGGCGCFFSRFAPWFFGRCMAVLAFYRAKCAKWRASCPHRRLRPHLRSHPSSCLQVWSIRPVRLPRPCAVRWLDRSSIGQLWAALPRHRA